MAPSCMKHIEIVERTVADPHVVRMHSLCSLIKESKKQNKVDCVLAIE